MNEGESELIIIVSLCAGGEGKLESSGVCGCSAISAFSNSSDDFEGEAGACCSLHRDKNFTARPT